MNYEKKYKEALERARSLYKDALINANSARAKHCELIFPELKESEDERIRKQIISFLKEFEYDHYRCLDFSSWIAWLERQGEQKPVDKVEPKFKNGQWIVWKDKCYKVNYNGCGYELVDQNGLSTSLEYGTIDENAHLWTIDDAKEGDVLVWNGSKCITLFKNIYDEDSFNSYGLVGHCTGIFEPRPGYHDIEGAHPATKEQCDILFAKMKEAGYEWDKNTKKLIKL